MSDSGDDSISSGLGDGTVSDTLIRWGLTVDVIGSYCGILDEGILNIPESDPMIYTAVKTHFDLAVSNNWEINLTDPARYIQDHSEYDPKWKYVIQDCRFGGMDRFDVLTLEYWENLASLVVEDGIIAVVSRSRVS